MPPVKTTACGAGREMRDRSSTTLARVASFRLLESHLDAADQVRCDVVKDRADSGHGGNQNNVHRADDPGVAEDSRGREPVRGVDTARSLARGHALDGALQCVEYAEAGEGAVE